MDKFAQIESHSSMDNNRRIIGLFAVADGLSLASSNKPNLDNVLNYFYCLEQIHINVKDVIVADEIIKQIKTIRQWIYMMHYNMITNTVMRTEKNLFRLAFKCKQFNSLLVSGLQQQKFFFRVGTRALKGLTSIYVLDDSEVFPDGEGEDGTDKEEIETEV